MPVDNQLRLDLLREALPYIQRFQGQTFVVKLSGKVTENSDNLASLAEELALPPVKIHCSILAEDAIKAAVQDYKAKHGSVEQKAAA